jgi:hypothetical protein
MLIISASPSQYLENAYHNYLQNDLPTGHHYMLWGLSPLSTNFFYHQLQRTKNSYFADRDLILRRGKGARRGGRGVLRDGAHSWEDVWMMLHMCAFSLPGDASMASANFSTISYKEQRILTSPTKI